MKWNALWHCRNVSSNWITIIREWLTFHIGQILQMSIIVSGPPLLKLIQLGHGLSIIFRNDAVLFTPSRSFSLWIVSHRWSVLDLTPTHLCTVPPCSWVHSQLLTWPLLLSDPQKISSHLSKTLHYYSLPVIPVTERPQSTRHKCKKHSVKINSVYRLGGHEMEIAGAV